MALNSPFGVRIEKSSVDDLDGEMGEHRRLIEEAVADLRAKHKHARRPNWPAWAPDPFNQNGKRLTLPDAPTLAGL
jgi:hypothetical protein